MNQCPYISPVLQYPTSCDSLKVTPNAPYKLLLSDGDYLLNLESFTFDHGASQQWLHRNGNANDILYHSFNMQSMNVSFEATMDEFQHRGRPSKFDEINTKWSFTFLDFRG